ncbi:YbaB/EbfC family nucleoid-associated protein [Neolewinella aurantiaca]|uniref:Nucleoid-associated protein FUA23_17465 n=1 Tax=Neolewinella aurantiaca TaxID=2602767 RepID=A0A5C7FQS2_9BACT|nr:YbaB/EbfC family nucleoid-associated protein [Neolewinella aurantiaca]TXF87722.1 YbaB/EbfC family nucleoid-associated protein [Neolewinella aurantiaca]
MFGDMMNQMQEMQEQMKKQLEAQTFTAEAGGGAVTVTCTGAREITNVKIDPELLDPEDAEGLEDLIVVATNRVLEKAAEYEQGQAGNMMNSMLPGGLGGLFGG